MTSAEDEERISRYGPPIGLLLIIVLFGVVRLPVLLHAPGSQDEEWYGVPGWSIAQSGVPSVPYCRADEPGSVFFGAEEMLFAQPPLSFYVQAPFFLVFSTGYAAARMASFAAACLSIIVVFLIGQRLFSDCRVSLLAAFAYSWSRLLYFPALSARPDMLCGLLGLVAVWMMLRFREEPKKWLAGTGVSVGLAGLTHPFALVFAIQTGVWTMARSGSFVVRVVRCMVLGLITAATFCLWLPLILQRPDLFRAQFIGNILRPAGPGLLSRFAFPVESFADQIPQLFERAHPIQFTLLAIGLVIGMVYVIKSTEREFALLWALAVSSIYLLVVCVGVHPIQGFWCYPAALCWLCVAKLVVVALDGVPVSRSRPGIACSMIMFMLLLLSVPGSGLRATAAFLSNWNRDDYAVNRFVVTVLYEIPEAETITVGPEFSLEAAVIGRDVILACQNPMYFNSARWPTKYLVLGRRDFELRRLEQYRALGHQLRKLKTFGSRDGVFTNYAEVWQIEADD